VTEEGVTWVPGLVTGEDIETEVRCRNYKTYQYAAQSNPLTVPMAQALTQPGVGRAGTRELQRLDCITSTNCHCPNEEQFINHACAADQQVIVNQVIVTEPDLHFASCEVTITYPEEEEDP
jgi:hypothetical protein